MFSQDTSFLTAAWNTDTLPTSQQFNNPSWESTQTWGDDDVDINSIFTLPASIEDASMTVGKTPVEPHQTMAEFYWALAANSSTPGADPKLAGGTGSTGEPFVAPLTPPEAEQAFSSESGQSTPIVDYGALSPVSSSGGGSSNSSTSKPSKKMLRTSTRKSAAKDERKTLRRSAPNSKEAKLQRAKNCHNLVEKKYRNRLNNNFELLLTTVTELRRQQDNTDECGMVMEDDDNESLSSKATSKGDLNHERSMSKSDVLRLARETVLDLERKNRGLLREVERLKAITNDGCC